ncbi:tRNA 4-thiouridine(8) synthase ThiI [Patescibacteria group bacterium]|nr:tRNA 4-thiouridine(8) synthase ThiI [Patescibacteria group bacterium]
MENIFHSIITHSDELNLKGKNQDFFIRKLIENIKNLLPCSSARNAGRKLHIEFNKKISSAELAEHINLLKLLPGISNIAPAIMCTADLGEIKQTVLRVVNFYEPRTFKINTVRSNKKFSLNSMAVDAEVGGFILEKIKEDGKEIKVDVRNPELEIKIEIGKMSAAVLGRKEEGIGGLPAGTAGKVLCLMSGGIDSPVAAFEMMKRGAKVDFVHFKNQTINRGAVENKIKKLVQCLARVQGESVLHIVPFADLQSQVIANIPADIRMIVYRRLMFKLAEKLCAETGAKALATGDSLAQVASQTLENLNVIYEASSMLKLPPLIAQNKRQIMDLAKKIGTYEISIEPYQDCCSFFIARHPETRAEIGKIIEAEKKLDVDDLIENALAKKEKFIFD